MSIVLTSDGYLLFMLCSLGFDYCQRDHSAIHRRGWAGWLSERRLGFEFLRQEEENATADGCGCGGFELKIVGNGQWEKFVAFRSSQMNELM